MKMNNINKEHLVIAVAWLFVYAYAPLYIWYADTLNGFQFNVGRMFGMWIRNGQNAPSSNSRD